MTALFAKLLLIMRLKISVASIFTVLLHYCLLISVHAQTSTADKEHDTIADAPVRIGQGVTAPRPIFNANPEYSEEARKANFSGNCLLQLIVGADGKPHDIKVVRKIGMGLDEKAIETVRTWRFEPARKNGQPVAVRINVEVTFNTYREGDKLKLSPEQLKQAAELKAWVQSQVFRISENQTPRVCAPSPRSTVTVADLNFDGALTMTTADRDGIATLLEQQSYTGDRNVVLTEVLKRVNEAWQEHGYFKVQVNGEARTLSSSPVNERIAIAVHVDEGPQYRLKRIAFSGNNVLNNERALRNLFPIKNGDIFNYAKIMEGVDKFRVVYGDYGRIKFAPVLQPKINEKNQMISLDVDCDEGKQFFVSRIDIAGLDEPAFQKARGELGLKPGDVYNQRLVNVFLKEHSALLPTDASPEPRFKLQLDEQAATVAITYDFRQCSSK